MDTAHWHFVKRRTADPAGGAVYVNDDRTRYRRTGGEALAAEAAHQRQLAELGCPVPRVLEEGTTHGKVFVVEESLGERSLRGSCRGSTRFGRLDALLVEALARSQPVAG
ncbi:hypothetical protein [Streptomyces decoyicus]|uniref:hypothetical protein n=1 Tax=Streptomyces decoyicus TaxID=249567 RepID=UPI0038307CEB